MAANRQTPVSKEAFTALTPFQKSLQQLMNIYSEEMPIKVFYERRSGEECPIKNLAGRHQIITLHGVIRAAESVLFQRPDRAAKNNQAYIRKAEPTEHNQDAYLPHVT